MTLFNFSSEKRISSLSDTFPLTIECSESNLILQKVLETLYPGVPVQWAKSPHLHEIDTYVLFYLCSYGVEEGSLLREAIQRSQQILHHPEFKSQAHVLIVVYRNLKVAFPERKLKREKVMSEMFTEDLLNREVSRDQHRIGVTHEFGLNNLQDTVQHLTGSHLYFEIQARNFL